MAAAMATAVSKIECVSGLYGSNGVTIRVRSNTGNAKEIKMEKMLLPKALLTAILARPFFAASILEKQLGKEAPTLCY